jgi:hypothetical protein
MGACFFARYITNWYNSIKWYIAIKEEDYWLANGKIRLN